MIPPQNEARWGDGEFAIDGDILTITWLSTNPTCQPSPHVDTFRRRAQPVDGVVLPPVAIYESDAPTATSRRDMSTPLVNGGSTGNL